VWLNFSLPEHYVWLPYLKTFRTFKQIRKRRNAFVRERLISQARTLESLFSQSTAEHHGCFTVAAGKRERERGEQVCLYYRSLFDIWIGLNSG